MNKKSARGANSCTGTAMGAFAFDALDVFACLVYLDAVLLKEFDPFLKILSSAEQFQHHNAFFSGKNFSFKYGKCQVKILDQLTDQRFLHFGLWKMKNQYFGMHINPPKNTLFLSLRRVR